MNEAVLKVFRGNADGGEEKEYRIPVTPGMVVLDAIHHIQGHMAPDLAVRWNCKAGKCGSCGAEVNGKPRLMCKTRMDEFPEGEHITVHPMKAFAVIKGSGGPMSPGIMRSTKRSRLLPRTPIPTGRCIRTT